MSCQNPLQPAKHSAPGSSSPKGAPGAVPQVFVASEAGSCYSWVRYKMWEFNHKNFYNCSD